ncbi:Imm7 family immunity protein [Singulisphaera sp. PoT]|uniref:Imm7 family immunity protein n=1 Tax=Singulisphaera sp. PoT TaxID=3411797 RepID=UPI003BF4F959
MMIFAAGWCFLRTSRDIYAVTSAKDASKVDEAIDAADARLWEEFRQWISANASPWLLCTFNEHHNNHKGFLQVYLSRNHRSSPFWAMLEWIAEHGPASYGLFYVHDDEDTAGTRYGRGIPEDYDNVFRVHRVMNGRVDELADPFFGPIVPNLEPVHPYDRELLDDTDAAPNV